MAEEYINFLPNRHNFHHYNIQELKLLITGSDVT
jgi:hypothetical protein